MIAHEIAVKSDLPELELDGHIARLAAVDWSRTNRDWFGMIGAAEQDEHGNPVLDEHGRERVVMSGGKGDQALRRTIVYLRRQLGLKIERAKLNPDLLTNIGSDATDMSEEVG